MISNSGVPTCGDQVPPLEEEVNDDQASVDPPFLMDGDIRDTFLQMVQATTTKTKASTTQTRAMLVKANREVIPRENQQVSTMASRLRDFT